MQKLKQKQLFIDIFSYTFQKQEYQQFAFFTNKFFRIILPQFFQYSTKIMYPFKKISIQSQTTYYNINEIDLIQLVKTNQTHNQIAIYRSMQGLLTFYQFRETQGNQLRELYSIIINSKIKKCKVDQCNMIQTGSNENDNNLLILYVFDSRVDNAFMFLKLNRISNRFEMVRKIDNYDIYDLVILSSLRNLEDKYFLVVNMGTKFTFYESQIPKENQIKLNPATSRSQIKLQEDRYFYIQVVELKDYTKRKSQKNDLTSIIAYTFIEKDQINLMKVIYNISDSKQNLRTERLKCVKCPTLDIHTLQYDQNNEGIIFLVGEISMPKETTTRQRVQQKNGILKIDLKNKQIMPKYNTDFACLDYEKITDLHCFKLYYSNYINEKHQIMYSVKCDESDRFQILTYHTQNFEDGNCFLSKDSNQNLKKQNNYKEKYKSFYGYLKCLQVSKNILLIVDDDHNKNQLVQLKLKFQ